MAKAPKWGVNTYHKQTKKKRPGRHAKSYSKRIPHRKKNRGQGRWQNLQVYKISLQKFYVFTGNTNISVASPLSCKYSKNMNKPNPLLFPPSNCVVHEDDVDWGGI